jgi:hypothetical protein
MSTQSDAARLAAVVVESLDESGDTDVLARRAARSRTQFFRVFRAQLDTPLDNSPHVFPWLVPARSLRDLLNMFAHVITFNTYQRLLALDELRRLGVKVEGFGRPTEYEASLARAR